MTVLLILGLMGATVLTGVSVMAPWSSAAATGKLPDPRYDETIVASSRPETAVFAGGCFWGVQGVFQHVKGVINAESGYAGGDAATAHYDDVSTGSTGHAESVRITYDPTQVTFGQLLNVLFTLVEDPTQLNRQGPDEGTQYRSTVFAQNADQQRIAQSYITQLDEAKAFPDPIVTTVTAKTAFYPAEAYHQNFLESNPDYPYIAMYDRPKLADLKRLFPQLYRDMPVLVAVGHG
ncbi:peptide-methionine (S)-S-oxide reductase MsrA [Mycolicibacterium sp. CBMA 226]|uniref:peptide-methionine (S)-S-oxide reductase MsrA n=1 Tax=Mycolicibacterium sp. CBMA 226 TaxID=2606611 RepID=UPI0012DBF6CD|nr:peptide-methionine (S)-S-oxide reductase MsrA [Mycolicibacterium sp. CBMA 226]MUL77146.1 peptide-methionine (S)-S-oxide reductase MsrA [Mycolicibacterium sp. CBMA 226]